MLVHGAWHDARCWQLLVPLLEAHGLEVLAPDLPGHGENRQDPASINLKAYSRYISQLIDNIENNVILVGHSMGGMVISRVAEENPGQVSRLVYLSAYLPTDGQGLFDLIDANRDAGGPAPIEQVMRMSADKRTCSIAPEQIAGLFYNRCPPQYRDLIPAAFPPQSTLPLSGKVSLSKENFGRVPRTYICCLDDRVIPIKHQRRMLSRQGCDEMIQLDADHSPFVSCPQTLADVLFSVSLAR